MQQYRNKLLGKGCYGMSYTRVTEELQELIFNHVNREHDRVNKHRGSETNPEELQELIFNHVKKDIGQSEENRGNLRMTRGSRALEKHSMLK
ncbi:hypothetical protein Patl1_34649 [Pistacia atlantica]|uniref:Uncharacterized protein n=1 Tax=Pistacia atlantica TaxID=434234 RepID=A0ACC0ZTE1_9ROSI|nr:hypothetical protein Patl1_34649 [Pistacia atlantica]